MESVFCAYRLGSDCNPTSGKSFSNADCDLYVVRQTYSASTSIFCPRPFIIKIVDIFKRGMQLLRCMEDPKPKEALEQLSLSADEKKALQILYHFLADEENLKKLQICIEKSKSGAEATVGFAKHLLSKLSPGQSYLIDERNEGKPECPCRCQTPVNYSPTGIGHESVWHGFLDIVLPSAKYDSAATVSTVLCEESTEESDETSDEFVTPAKKLKLQGKGHDDGEETEHSPGGSCVTEVKKSDHFSNQDTANQSFSQTITFSMLQKKEYPDLENFLIPNIVLSSLGSFRVIMYDAENDILIRSKDFTLYVNGKLVEMSIRILWMVLHYKLFCNGINIALQNEDLKSIQSEFRKHVMQVPDMWEIYCKCLKFCVNSFPRNDRSEYDMPEDADFGVDFFKMIAMKADKTVS